MLWEQLAEFLASDSTWTGAGSIWTRLWEHVWISVTATILAIVLVFPLALWLGHTRRGAEIAGAVVNVGRAVPTFGILVVIVLLAVELGWSVLSVWPLIVALVALAAPPVFTNTIAGIQGVSPATVEAARGMGLTEVQLVRQVEMPLAAPVIAEGMRIAFVQVIATATLGALLGKGGLGRFIVDGFSQQDQGEVLAGAVLVALLAVIAEVGLSYAQKAMTPRGVRPEVERVGSAAAS